MYESVCISDDPDMSKVSREITNVTSVDTGSGGTERQFRGSVWILGRDGRSTTSTGTLFSGIFLVYTEERDLEMDVVKPMLHEIRLEAWCSVNLPEGEVSVE